MLLLFELPKSSKKKFVVQVDLKFKTQIQFLPGRIFNPRIISLTKAPIMVEVVEENLTKGESELYDRQIRLWGLESQKRFSRLHFLNFSFVDEIIFYILDCETPKFSSLDSTDWELRSPRTSSWLV